MSTLPNRTNSSSLNEFNINQPDFSPKISTRNNFFQPKFIENCFSESSELPRLTESEKLEDFKSKREEPSTNFLEVKVTKQEKKERKSNHSAGINKNSVQITDKTMNIYLNKSVNISKGSPMRIKTSNNVKFGNSPQNKRNSEPKKFSLYDTLSRFYLVKKFVHILKNDCSFRKLPLWFNNYHFTLINDNSYFNEENYYEKNGCFTDFVKKLPIFPIFDTNSFFSLVWDFFILISILWFFILIPLNVCFKKHEIFCNYYIININIVIFYMFIVDICKKFNTSYYEKGSLVKNRTKIIIYYLRSDFLKDFLSLIPLFISVFIKNSMDLHTKEIIADLINFVIYLKISYFIEIFNKLEEQIFSDSIYHNTFSLIKLISGIVFLSHLFACAWYYIGTNPLYYQNTWFYNVKIMDQSFIIQYLYSYYFVCVTMNTVGYGDITPQNPLEVIFTIIFIFFACGIFAYSLNSIGNILNEISKRNRELVREKNILNVFMKEKKINFELQMRVRKYLEYIWKEENIEAVEKQMQVISKLSDSLKEELLLEANGHIVRDTKLFSLNFSEETLRKTMNIMKEVRYTPGDVIIMKNDINNNSLYIVRKGEVEIYMEPNEMEEKKHCYTPIVKLKSGDVFGELGFFSETKRSVSVRSTDFTNVFMINRGDFLQIIRNNDRDYQRFCEIKDKMSLYQDQSDLYLRCFGCNNTEHIINQCPILHYIPKKDIVLLKFNHNNNQERNSIKRKRKIKNNSLANLQLNEKIAYEIQELIFPKHISNDSENESVSSSSDSATIKSQESSKDENDIYLPEDINILEKNKHKRNNIKQNPIKIKEDQLEFALTSFEDNIKINKSNHEILERKENDKIVSQQEILNLKSLIAKIIENNNSLKTKETEVESIKNNKILTEKEFFSIEYDRIKSFSEYFCHNNIETIIEKDELDKIFNLKNKHSNRKQYRIFLENTLFLNETVPEFLRGRLFKKIDDQKIDSYFNNKIKRKKVLNDEINPFFKKNFFKNSNNMIKLIEQQEIDPEKIKDYYKRKLTKNLPLIRYFLKKCFRNCFGKLFNYAKKKKPIRNLSNK